MLLQVAGAPEGTQVTISYVAQRLGLRHHTAVELSKRCEAAGLVQRVADVSDRRCVLLHLTEKGQTDTAALVRGSCPRVARIGAANDSCAQPHSQRQESRRE